MLAHNSVLIQLRWTGFERAGGAEPELNERERKRSPVSCRPSAGQELALLSPFQWERGVVFQRFGGEGGGL